MGQHRRLVAGSMRRPPGDTVDHPVPGVRYRHPWYKDGHIFLTIEGDEAACGRILLVDEGWWVDSGNADNLGELYLIEDQRGGSKCGSCTKYWGLHFDGLRARKKADIFTKKERPEAIVARNVQIETMKAWQAHFERFWGEPTELLLEAR